MNVPLKIIDDAIEQRLAAHRPRAAGWLERGMGVFDAAFDWCYGSKYNPLYRSGTIAVTLISIVMVTGAYLLLFYDVSAPYASVVRIEEKLWFGSMMRAVHRYASDATVVAVVVHFLRIMAQGKSWGPQRLAFLTGIALTGLLLFAGFTGYVMIWDRFGREIAIGGAVLLDTLPFFGESLQRSFDGGTPLLSSFFFLNMFMHVALPLFMVFGMYLHTARLPRSVWFPNKRLTVGIIAAFVLLGALWPAPLEAAADAFALPLTYVADLFFGVWIPPARSAPAWVLGLSVGMAALITAAPWWWRPRAAEVREPSKNDEAVCEGCGQCTKDCPYEAILMVPRVSGEGSATVARVQPDLCMSCGVCSASCTRMRIGPPERTGLDQQSSVRAFLEERRDQRKAIVIVTCGSNPGGLEWLRGDTLSEQADVFPLSCLGSLHPFVVQRLLRAYDGVFCWGCPPRNCAFREGPVILSQRLLESREPTVPGSIESDRVCVAEYSPFEKREVRAEFRAFAGRLTRHEEASGPVAPRKTRPFVAGLMTLALLASLGALSAVSLPTGAPPSELLLSWRLAGQSKQTCRDLTPSELSSIPKHMQREGQQCTTAPIPFRLVAELDGEVVVEKTIRANGARGDQPIVVDVRLDVTPGRHRVHVDFSPVDAVDRAAGLRLAFEEEVDFREGGRRALFFNKTAQTLELSPGPSLTP